MNFQNESPAQPLDPSLQRTSQRYAVAQTTLLILFALVDFLSPKVYLFASPGAALAGNVLCAVGIGIMLVALVFLRGTVQIAPEPKAGRNLVEAGIYKYLRHPIYTGIVLSAAGLFLRQPSVYIGVAALVVIVFLTVKVRFEEKLLQISYPEYASYRNRTWGLFPGLRY